MNSPPAAIGALAKGDISNFLVASTPGGIEQQERRGQAEMVRAADRLPIQILDRGITQADIASHWGVVFGNPIDDLFVSAILPAGWSIRASEHQMHSDIIDDKGRERGGVFYKAAFYDRRADLRVHQRYIVQNDYQKPLSTVAIVDTADTSKELHIVGTCGYTDYPRSDELEAEARAWLATNFPDYLNPFAYWD